MTVINWPSLGSGEAVNKAELAAAQKAVEEKAAAEVKEAEKGKQTAFNVKTDFGAKGDGVTGDSAAIQAAINAAEILGGIVFFPAGTYRIDSTLLVGANIILRGAGWTSSILKAKKELNAPVIESKNFATTGSKNGAIDELCVDGNKAENTLKKDGIRLASQNWVCRSVISRNCIGAGFSNAILSETEKQSIGVDNAFYSCRALNCESWGFYIEAHDTLLLDCQGIQNAEYSFYWATTGYAIQCHSWCYDSTLATATKTGWRLGTTVRCINCIAEGATERQVQFVGNGSRWIGGEVFNGVSKPNATLFEFNGGASIWIDGPYCHDFGTGGAFKFTTNGAGSYIAANCFDPGGNSVTVGAPSENIRWDLELGGGTALGEARYTQVKQLSFSSFNPGTVPNRTLYRDTNTGRLRYKDGLGTTRDFQLAAMEIVEAVNTITVSTQCSMAKCFTLGAEIKKINATFAGHRVCLVFIDAMKVIDGENLKLAGNFEATSDDTLDIICDGVNWYEVGRSAN